MDPHPLHFISYTTLGFRFLWKDDVRVVRHGLNFCVMNTTCKSHNLFNLLAKFCVRLPLFCKKKLLDFHELAFSMFFWCCFQLIVTANYYIF